MEKKGRIGYIDLAGGILIIWVMMFHAINNCKVFGDVDTRVAIPWLTFSMPWFFFKSGQFFRPRKGTEGIKGDVKKFIPKFLLWGLLGYLVNLVMLTVDGNLSWKTGVGDALQTFWIYGYIPINTPLWFLLTLFFVRVFSGLLAKLKVHPVVWIVAGIAAGYACHLADNPAIPYWVANIPMGIAFFFCGLLLAPHQFKQWLLLPCIAGYLAFTLFGFSIVGHHRNILLEGHYLLWPVFAVCGIVVFNNLCKWVYSLTERARAWKFRPLSFIGRNTMTLLVSHALIYAPIVHYSRLSPIRTVLLITLCYIILLTPLTLLSQHRD